MKLIITSGLLALGICGFSSAMSEKRLAGQEQKFLIKSIRKYEGVYVIQSVRNDTVFSIVSKIGLNKGCRNVKKGARLGFVLNNYPPSVLIINHYVSKINFYRTLVPLKLSPNGIFYTVDGLDGLCWKI